MNVEAPRSFVVPKECEKAAWQNGFRRGLGEQAGWASFGSTTARAKIHLAAAGKNGPWFLALDHAGVVAEMRLPKADMPVPGLARHGFDNLGRLYATLRRVYELGVSLPDGPLKEFEAKTANLPKTTEAERLIVQRIGQDIFRDRLMDYLAGPLPAHGDHRPGAPARLAHHSLGRLRERRRTPQRSQRPYPFRPLGRGLRPRPRDLRRRREPAFSPTLSGHGRAELRWKSCIPLTGRRLAQHRERAMRSEQWDRTYMRLSLGGELSRDRSVESVSWSLDTRA
jgi:hypothetical protein